MEKLKVISDLKELSSYWKFRASELLKIPNSRGIVDPFAELVSVELYDCARQLDRIVEGKETEASGFYSEI